MASWLSIDAFRRARSATSSAARAFARFRRARLVRTSFRKITTSPSTWVPWLETRPTVSTRLRKSSRLVAPSSTSSVESPPVEV